MRFLPGNAQHIGARHSQQDSFGFADPDDREFLAHGGFLAIICDGMGGMEYGDAASRTAVRAFLDAYQRKTPEESIPAALERSVREANNQVVALAHSLGLSERIGTTLAAAALHDHSFYYISVGDSGVFYCSQGQCRAINHPHIFANMLDAAVARGTLSREDAASHPERESLTSFIGAESLEEIDRNVEPFPLAPGDTILLASDGMFKTLNDQEILAALEGAPQGWPEALVARTLDKKREYQDNVTVLSVTAEADDATGLPVSELPRTVVRAPAPPPQFTPPVPPVPPPAWTPPVSLPAPPPVRSRTPWPLILILVILIAGAAGWWLMTHRRSGAMMPSPIVTDPRMTRPPGNQPPDDKNDQPDPSVRGPAPAGAPVPGSAPRIATPLPETTPRPNKPADK